MTQPEHFAQIRHSTAHLLAAAIKELYPHAKPAIGPATEHGFYYDFDFGTEVITDADFAAITKKMREIYPTWKSFERKEVTPQEARTLFAGNPYKLEIIDELEKNGEVITTYTSGTFVDLCKGGHVNNPSMELGVFALLSLAGAYWRGSEKNKMLTRIYGTAFSIQFELDEYLKQMEEAKKRDHKKLGKELDLFVFSPLVGSGLPLWTPKGTVIREELDDFIWQIRRKHGYMKVAIPHITKKDLYETSGHWDKFKDELFKIETREGDLFAMKPMNCPHHTQIYARKPHSYKELPVRLTETTMVYRDEQSGELAGLSRVRSITQDDAHVFLRMSQVESEFLKTWDIVDEFYSAFGFSLRVRISLHDPEHMEKYLGDEASWNKAENILRDIAQKRSSDSFEGIGEAALYGPKLDFMAKDSIGREWQVATIQLDLNQPKRFNLTCINEEGQEEGIVMMHCAVMGSIERFMSILIEHYAGAFPTWLAPVQVELLPIADRHIEYAESVAQDMRAEGIRVEVNMKKDTLQAKIRASALQKVPFMGIIGDKELNGSLLSLRRRNEDLGQKPSKEFILQIKEDIQNRQ